MPKFFVPPEQIAGGKIRVIGADVAHIRRVLRHQVGDVLPFCDGAGMDYEAEIVQMDKEEIRARITESYPSLTEPDVKITLFQCIPKSGKMDYVIQKCTELGVSEVVPVVSSRAVGKMDGGSKLSRYQKIALEAAKQCGRGVVPAIAAPIPFAEAVQQSEAFDLVVFPYESAVDGSLRELLRGMAKPKRVALFIGPEGGFADEEVRLAADHGAKIVTLGPRILRTETAGSAVIAMIMYEFE